jgi:hypothetical protein
MDAPVISEPLLGMISCRSLLKLSGLAAASASLPALAQELAAPDYKLEIAPLTWELGPRHTIKTSPHRRLGQSPRPAAADLRRHRPQRLT